MKCRYLFLLGFLGIAACHDDARLATDVDSALLRSSAENITTPVVVQGKVVCGSCSGDDGMGVVVTSSLTGQVANGLYDQVGGYQVIGTAKPGDTLTIRVTLTRSGGVTGKSATVTVPGGGGTIQQDFQFQ